MGKLQLFKFREMYEKRYHDSIGVSDLYKMKDVVTITEEHSGTFYFRLPNLRFYSPFFKNIQVDNLLFVWIENVCLFLNIRYLRLFAFETTINEASSVLFRFNLNGFFQTWAFRS